MGEIKSHFKETSNDLGKEIKSNFNTDVSQAKDFVKSLFRDIKDNYATPYGERINRCPKDGERGNFIPSNRGEGLFVPNEKYISTAENGISGKAVANELKKYGEKGIVFRNGFPIFDKVSLANVKIDKMTEKRYGNFEQADKKLAEQWNKDKKEGRIDWSARAIKEYRIEHHLSWHDKEDLKTCQLVPQTIHGYVDHSGGVNEYKYKNDMKEGNFDE